MPTKKTKPERYYENIRKSGFSIYDPIEIGDPDLWIPTPELEFLLNRCLTGKSLAGLPLRTRSKVVKKFICEGLGYPALSSFRKTKPRFPGQFFDTYIQKSNNLQVWNEELSPTRRYVIIRVGPDDVITKIKVVTGDTLSLLDTTGTLTKKCQARLVPGRAKTELVTEEDTDLLRPFTQAGIDLSRIANPTSYPDAGQLLPIKEIFLKLKVLIGRFFPYKGYDQERNRAAGLHRLVCKQLGYRDYRDDGRFPDVRHQLLEIKLQTSPTIDLGLVCPDTREALDVPKIKGRQIRHCDVRYAVFRGETDAQTVNLTHFFLTTGERFFSRFPQFQGKVFNKKLQIPLPATFFED